MQNIICMKWGTRYSSLYVNRLNKSIQRHTNRQTQLICFTDDQQNIDSNIICRPLPEINLPKKIFLTPWRKLSVWQKPLLNLKGDVLFLDLDLVITGNLDQFFDFNPGKYCVIENWTQKGQNIGNTSCFKFPIGKYKYIFNNFQENPNKFWEMYHIEQNYLSKEIKDQVFWPAQWCLSFKHNLLPSWPSRIWKPAQLPSATSLVAFTGKPDPDDVIQGKWPVKKSQFYKKIYKQLTTPEWIIENWS